jgi:hypothetical protein
MRDFYDLTICSRTGEILILTAGSVELRANTSFHNESTALSDCLCAVGANPRMGMKAVQNDTQCRVPQLTKYFRMLRRAFKRTETTIIGAVTNQILRCRQKL